MFDQLVSRRSAFNRLGGGLGTVALASIFDSIDAVQAETSSSPRTAITHHAPEAVDPCGFPSAIRRDRSGMTISDRAAVT